MNIKFNQRNLKLTIAAGVLVGSASICAAAEEMKVTATVGEACLVTIEDTLDFGAYDGILANATTHKDVDFSVSALCSLDTKGTMNINPGLNAVAESGTETPLRQMANGSSRLKYNLYKDAGRSTIWGAGVDTGGNLHTGTGITKSIVGFARLDAGQVVPDGAYSDTITISVDY